MDLLIIIAGLTWCYGKTHKWDIETTEYIGWAFWLMVIFF